jgi:hypothetical protein
MEAPHASDIPVYVWGGATGGTISGAVCGAISSPFAVSAVYAPEALCAVSALFATGYLQARKKQKNGGK